MYDFLPSVKILSERNKDIAFSENAGKILEKRYLRKGDDGRPVEGAVSMFSRLSQAVAEPDLAYDTLDQAERAFFNLLSTKRFFPNSPTFTGAATPLGQLAACFVLPISDDMGKVGDGIFSTLKAAALIQQTGGGNGFSFSRLRPKGDLVRKSMGKASGPVGFLSVYDAAFGVVSQGGVRRGANMGVLRVDHPDIREFIKCKAEEGSVKNFNISVALTDKFMRAVEADDYFELINPRSGETWEKVKARELFDELVKYAYRNGEPGALFIDTANRANPVPHLYELEATNPCGEQWLGPYENCCLGSVNLAQHLVKTGKGIRLDWEKLAESFVVATHFLDNVVTANKYVPEVPELEKAATLVRRIGLGFMGLGDVLYALRIRYGSEEGIEFSAQVSEFMRYFALKESVALSRERGPFPAIKGSIYDKDDFRFETPQSLNKYTHDFGRPRLNWDSLTTDMRNFGVRNGAQTTVAPTGTISTVAEIEGYGCEPVFALAYVRNVYQAAMEEERLSLTYVSPLFEEALRDSGLPEKEREEVAKEVVLKGTCQHIKNLPDWLRHTFVVSGDITPEEHVGTQAAIQRFIDNSISKTCNFPQSATVDEVKKTYLLAWKLGCKGLTVYVTGSRKEVVLETHEEQEKKNSSLPESESATSFVSKDRAEKLSGSTYKIKTPQGRAFITVNRNGGDNIFEVFLNVGKAGSDTAAISEAMGRIISGWLRSSVNPRLTALEIIEQLSGIGGRLSVGYGQSKVSSLPDAVAKVLTRDLGITNGSETTLVDSSLEVRSLESKATLDFLKRGKLGDLCPECGNSSFVNEEGCRKCYACSYSEC